MVLSIELLISQTISVYSGRGEIVFEKNKSRTKLRKKDYRKDGKVFLWHTMSSGIAWLEKHSNEEMGANTESIAP